MRIGIDVGGTHTDAAALELNEIYDKNTPGSGGAGGACQREGLAGTGSRLVGAIKSPTNHDDLVHTVINALRKLLDQCPDIQVDKINRLTLSTTLTTNMVAEKRLEPVLTVVVPGPGISLKESFGSERSVFDNHFDFPGQILQLNGYTDHRGREVAAPSERELDGLRKLCRESGFKVGAAVSKFSQRNPDQEELLGRILKEDGGCEFVALGHRMSGRPGFPRRVGTAMISAAVWHGFAGFAKAVRAAMRELGLNCPINILKADCGTLPLAEAVNQPAETVLAGPAASVMGLAALCSMAQLKDDCIIIDIGGSTTDIAFVTHGSPVIANYGVNIGHWKTLVRGLEILFLPIGGDSPVIIDDGLPDLGSRRVGPCLAVGGPVASLMDCLNLFGEATYGDVELSRKGLEELSMYSTMDAESLAESVAEHAAERMARAALDKLNAINNNPVLTLTELLHGVQIKPSNVFLIGGPAEAFAPFLEQAIGLPVIVPEHYDVANAMGAALTRITMDLELFADTERGQLTIPSLGINRKIDRRYNVEDAKAEAIKTLDDEYLRLNTGNPSRSEITEAQSFNMIDGYNLVGRNIRVHCQIRPGLDLEYLPVKND